MIRDGPELVGLLMAAMTLISRLWVIGSHDSLPWRTLRGFSEVTDTAGCIGVPNPKASADRRSMVSCPEGNGEC